jgi:hypothetical protein
MANILTGYTFDSKSGRYRSGKTGRFVARKRITDLLEKQVADTEQQLEELATALHEGKIAPATFLAQARTEIKNAHLTNRALGAGGWEQLDSSDYGATGGALRSAYQKLVGTVEDVQRGEVSLPQVKQRMRSYSGDARRQYFDAEKRRRQPSDEGMVIIYRRIAAADANTCTDCMNYYEQGWQYDVPAPAERCACMGNCRCSVIDKEVPADEVGQWLGTKK